MHPEFEADRNRELMYSHHVFGYLRRIVQPDRPYVKVVATPEALAAVAAMQGQATLPK